MRALPEQIKTVDVHNHVRPGRDGKLDRTLAECLLEGATRLGIHSLCVSRPLTSDCPSPDDVRRANDVVLEAMAFSDRFLGFCFVNPGYAAEARAEIDRCVECGMVGIKLYHQYFVCDPAQTAVMTRASELGIPVLMHAGKVLDRATRARQPRLSNAEHFVRARDMYPDTMLIQGHIGGGGDWEWNLRVLETSRDFFVDISGSVIDAGIVRRTVNTIGAERVLFATDGVLEEGVGKLLDAGLTGEELHCICRGNWDRIASRRRK